MDTDAERTLRIVIADEQELLREGIARLLQARGFEVVAQSDDADELIAKATAHRPDVVLTDLLLAPDHVADGLRAAQAIRGELPDVSVLLLTHEPTPEGALELIDGDSRGVGYLQSTRTGDLDALTQALRRIASGGAAIDAAVAGSVIQLAAENGRINALSPRERAALVLMLEGRSDAEIARSLRITVPAAERHAARVHAALGIQFDSDPGLRAGALISFLIGDRRRDRPISSSVGLLAALDHEERRRPGTLVTGFERTQS